MCSSMGRECAVAGRGQGSGTRQADDFEGQAEREGGFPRRRRPSSARARCRCSCRGRAGRRGARRSPTGSTAAEPDRLAQRRRRARTRELEVLLADQALRHAPRPRRRTAAPRRPGPRPAPSSSAHGRRRRSTRRRAGRRCAACASSVAAPSHSRATCCSALRKVVEVSARDACSRPPSRGRRSAAAAPGWRLLTRSSASRR